MTGTTIEPQSLNKQRSLLEKSSDRLFIWLTRLLAISVVFILLWIAVEVGLLAIPAIKEFGSQFLISSAWNPPQEEYGILPTIYGTVVSSLIALLIAVPIGLASAIALSENFLPPSLRRGWVNEILGGYQRISALK
jgi:phosphate transport system permease protein